MATLALRAMTRNDLPHVERLNSTRNVHASEYERFLGLEGAYGLVLESDATLVAATTVMRYFEHAFVGPILQAPGADAAGVSIALLSSAVEKLQRHGVSLIESEASNEEEPFLRALGFRPIRRTTVWERAPGAVETMDPTRPMTPGDLLDVGALDAAAVGYGRKEYVAALRNAMPEGARVTADDAGVSGFALLRRARRGHHLGPLVTRDDDADAAARLLAGAAAQAPTSPLVALAPDEAHADAALAALGFRPVGALVRMRAGERAAPPGAAEWLLGGRITG